MELELHENAISAFNQKANRILGNIERHSVTAMRTGVVPSAPPNEPFVSAALDVTNTVGSRFEKLSFGDGRFCKATLTTNSEQIELQESGCNDLMALSESIWRAGNTAKFVGKEFINRAFFDWAETTGTEKHDDFVSFLSAEVEGAVQDYKILIPLHRVRSAVRFRMLGHLVREIHGDEIDAWFPIDENPELNNRMKQALQGYCCIEIVQFAEQNQAASEALRIANIITSVLAMHSMAGLTLQARYNGVPLGQENAQKYIALIFSPGTLLPEVKDGFMSTDDMAPFEIDEKALTIMGGNGLYDMANLFDGERKSDFQKSIRDSIFTFSRASFTRDTSEKLVFAVVAMEALFLANESEPISLNLADRLAFHLGSSLDERKKFVSTTKKAYNLRSKYVHHGKSAQDNDTISAFLILAYTALVNAVVATHKYSTKAEFLSSLDDMKYSV